MRQVDKVIEECKMAYLANVPIIYIVTDNYQLIDEIVKSDKIVEMVYQYEDETLTKREIKAKGGNLEELGSPLNYKRELYGTDIEIPFPMTGYSGPEIPQIGVVYNFDAETPKERGHKQLVTYVEKYMLVSNTSAIKKSLMILVGSTVNIPRGLENYIQVIDVPPLESDEIVEIIKDFTKKRNKEYGYEISDEFLEGLVTRFKGFEKYKIIEVLHRIKENDNFIYDIKKGVNDNKAQESKRNTAYSYIKKEKEQILKKTDILSIEEDNNVSVGGLEILKSWIAEQKETLANLEFATYEWNVALAKGLLITGVPGCGKSLMAKYTAREFNNIPLIQMDIGKLQSKYHGESEANMRKALKIVQAMAPCVLWIDEIEKGFAGTGGSGEADGGANQRAFATFLTWLQNKKEPIFAFITANDISKLPPELLRLGRISKKYSVSMPTYDECVDIFIAQINKKSQNNSHLFDKTIYSRYIGKIFWNCVHRTVNF